MLLNDNELKEITEYTYRAKQRKQLSKMGIPFMIGPTGKPLVSRNTIEKILGVKAERPQQQVNLQALNRLTNG